MIQIHLSAAKGTRRRTMIRARHPNGDKRSGAESQIGVTLETRIVIPAPDPIDGRAIAERRIAYRPGRRARGRLPKSFYEIRLIPKRNENLDAAPALIRLSA